jgi:hypothetical protein
VTAEGNFGLHDAELIAVAVDRLSRIARLSFRQEDGVSRSIELHGLQAFRAEDLTLQNVVSRVLRSSQDQFSREAIEHSLRWVTSLSDSASWLSDERRHQWLASCENRQLELFVLEPSAGAQVAALCERLVVV